MRLLRQFDISSGRFKIAILLASFLSVLLLLGLHSSWHEPSSGTAASTLLPSILDIFKSKQIPNDEFLIYGDDGSASSPNGTLPTRPALIAAARVRRNVKWMKELASTHDLYAYKVDDRHAPPRLSLPKNKGREAMVYLSFIINHYYVLPPYAIFVHGHERSWHQEGDIPHLAKALRFSALRAAGYVPLRCEWYPSCAAELHPVTHKGVAWGPGAWRRDAEKAIGEVWDQFFPGVEVPDTIASQCCAQFAVTREAILRRPREQYIRMRNWLLETDLSDDVSGRVLEKLWAYIMTGEAVHCPSPQSCACEFFGHCEPKHWRRPPVGWPSLPADSLNP